MESTARERQLGLQRERVRPAEPSGVVFERGARPRRGAREQPPAANRLETELHMNEKLAIHQRKRTRFARFSSSRPRPIASKRTSASSARRSVIPNTKRTVA